MNTRYFISLISLICLIRLILPTRVYATTGLPAQAGLTLSPPTLELMIAPNKAVVQNIELQNLGGDTTYRVELRQLLPIGQDGGSTISSKPLALSGLPFAFTLNGSSLSDFALSLPSLATSTLTLRLESATTDTNAEYYFALTFIPTLDGQVTSTPVVALPLLITLTPSGSLDLNLAIDDFDLPFVHDNLAPLAIHPLVHNQGHHMLRPQGELTLTPPFGSATTFPVDPQLVLAATSRGLRFVDSPTLAPSLLHFGPYRYTLRLTSPGGKVLATSERVVWLLPLRLTLLVIAAVLLVIAAIRKHSYTSSTPS